MRGKTGASLALACEVGALSACPDNDEMAAVCARFGAHMGVLMQILDDLDGTFRPVGIGDLRAGKITLPVLYGLAIDHEARTELASIVRSGCLANNADRVKTILDSIDTREFLVWCAFEEHKQAIKCLQELPAIKSDDEKNGQDALLVYANLLMAGWENLLDKTGQERSEAELDPEDNAANVINRLEKSKTDNQGIVSEFH